MTSDAPTVATAALWTLPLRGRGGVLFLAGSAIGALAAGAVELSIPILPDVLRTMLVLYAIVVGCHVTRDVARGGSTLAGWPGLPNREAFFIPVARVAGAAIWILGPIVATRLVANADPERSQVLFWLLLGLGGYLVPMVIARVAVRESFLAGHPIAVLISLFRTWKPYSIASIPFFIASFALGVSFTARPDIGAATSPIAAYLLLVAFAILGRFYARNEVKLHARAGKDTAEPTPDEGNTSDPTEGPGSTN